MSRSSTNARDVARCPRVMRRRASRRCRTTPLSASSIGSTTDVDHLVGARAGQQQRHVDRGGIGFREQVDAEVAEREDAEHHERHHEHRREDGPADAEFGEHVATPSYAASTATFIAVGERVDVGRRPPGRPRFDAARGSRCGRRAGRRSSARAPPAGRRSTTKTRLTP